MISAMSMHNETATGHERVYFIAIDIRSTRRGIKAQQHSGTDDPGELHAAAQTEGGVSPNANNISNQIP